MAAARAYVPRLLRRALARARRRLPRGGLVPRHAALRARRALAAARRSALAAVAGAWTVAAVFGAGFVALALALVTGLIQARAGLRTWLALLAAPWYLVWKAVVQLRALASVLRRDDYYRPTART